jgi:hypothetical protein
MGVLLHTPSSSAGDLACYSANQPTGLQETPLQRSLKHLPRASCARVTIRTPRKAKMDDLEEEAALRPPLHAEWELTDSDEEFPLLARIGANQFGQESKAAAKAAAGGSIHEDSLVAEGETTVPTRRSKEALGNRPRSPSC